MASQVRGRGSVWAMLEGQGLPGEGLLRTTALPRVEADTDAPAGRVGVCSFLGKLSVTAKEVIGMLQNQLGISGVQGQVLSHRVWSGAQNSAFLPAAQTLQAC